ncbi:MAG TPA: hypothetical protein VN788_15615, partial [Verrucomicrobiae bacterium]|nr:hypothetical protein [Verrucomicrobiae bacterium]
ENLRARRNEKMLPVVGINVVRNETFDWAVKVSVEAIEEQGILFASLMSTASRVGYAGVRAACCGWSASRYCRPQGCLIFISTTTRFTVLRKYSLCTYLRELGWPAFWPGLI